VQATIQGAILIIFGIILTYFFGITGVILASIFSNVYRDIDLIVFVPRNITKLPIRSTLYRLVRIFCFMIIMGLPFIFIKINPTGYLSWFAVVGVVSIYAVFVTLLMGYIFDREEMLGVFKRLKRIKK